MCAAGDVTCEARYWTTGSSNVTAMTYSCFACMKLTTVTNCVKGPDTNGGATDVQVSKYVSTVTGTFTQNTANTTA